MKGNQILGIGFLVLSITLILKQIFSLPDFVYLLLLILAIILEVIGVIKIKSDEKKK